MVYRIARPVDGSPRCAAIRQCRGQPCLRDSVHGRRAPARRRTRIRSQTRQSPRVAAVASGSRHRDLVRDVDEQALPGRIDGVALHAGRRDGVCVARADRSGAITAGLRTRLPTPQNKITLARPRNRKNPIASVTNVSSTLDPYAGSRPVACRPSGIATPTNPATTRFNTTALVITTLSATFEYSASATSPTTTPQTDPLSRLTSNSLFKTRHAPDGFT